LIEKQEREQPKLFFIPKKQQEKADLDKKKVEIGKKTY